MMFNINEEVRVRLTDAGRKKHREDHFKEFPFLQYIPPEEDENGWSTWQLWYLMESFGKHVHMGVSPPFETEIEIVEKDGK